MEGMKMKLHKIRLHGHIGTWYAIDATVRNGNYYYLLESEVFGDEAPCLIVDANYQIIKDEVYNGLEELDL
jgi:hypothetical protein